MENKVCVLMSTYNGSEYISQQIDSIFGQNEVQILLMVRDDGSKDNTVDIIKARQEYQEGKIILKAESNIGVTRSFYELIRSAYKDIKEYEYFAFADQDDVWLPEKLSIAINCISKYKSDVPNLYYSNLTLVDKNLNYLNERFSKGYVTNTKQQIMAEICTYGCTCVFNKATLMEMAKLNDEKLEYHDNWALWVASFLGNCFYDENSYILYRQHGNNTSGQVQRGKNYLYTQLKRMTKLKNMTPCYELKAKLMLQYYDGRLCKADRENLWLLAHYKDNFFLKLKLLFTSKIKSGHIIRDLGRKVRILINKA